MPIPQVTRVNPLDLQKTIAIGVSLPFNGPKGPFNSTYSTKDQVKSNLINLLLTDKGERVFNPEFGVGIRRLLFEGLTEDIVPVIQELITTNVNIFVPDAIVERVDVVSKPDSNTLNITLVYSLRISGTSDQVTVEFI